MDHSFSIGEIVLSKAGRDSGKLFVVVAAEGIFAYICDGDIRKTGFLLKRRKSSILKRPAALVNT